MSKKNSLRFYIPGFAGFFGLFGFRYFFTGDPGDLFSFVFLAFFSFFILGKINSQMQDELWKANSRKASQIAYGVAISFIFIVGFFFSNFELPKEFIAGGCALGWIASLFTYALAFKHYERA